MKPGRNKALIEVDVQNDFCRGGALPVPKGDEVVPAINELMWSGKFSLIVNTKDWHPENHCSFIENGGRWKRHCVQFTEGARLHPDLSPVEATRVYIHKGDNPAKEAYSGFDGTPLGEILDVFNIGKVYICGLATDYCVKATALDAQRLGFKTFVVIDACRGLEVNKGDVEKYVAEMRDAEIEIITSKEV